MTNEEMAVAVLRMLHDWPPENDDITVHLEYSTIHHCPELRVHHFNDRCEVIKSEFYGRLHSGSKSTESCVIGSFEEGFKRLEELIYG